MVRNYVRKTTEPSYDEGDVQAAIEKVMNKEWTFAEAARFTKVPIGTIASRISRKSCSQVGHPTALQTSEEKYLVELIITLQDYGQLCTCENVLRYASEFVSLMKLENRFKNRAPTKDWYYGFVQRWADQLKIMSSNTVEEMRRAPVTVATVDDWFVKLHSVLSKLDLFNQSQQIFNCGELIFLGDRGNEEGFVRRESRHVNKVHTDGIKESITVLITISANGICLPPFVIYKANHMYDAWCPKDVIPGIVYNTTESGWVDEDRFFDYLNRLFIPGTKHLDRPLLLILDSHISHLSLKTTRLAVENQIHILCLPFHATHILQPFDVYTLKFVKTQWQTLLWEFKKKNLSKTLEKSNFIHMFAKLYNHALLPNHCSVAFREAGIVPFDPCVVKRQMLMKVSTPQNTESTRNSRRSKSLEPEQSSTFSAEMTNGDASATSITPISNSSFHRNLRTVRYSSDPLVVTNIQSSFTNFLQTRSTCRSTQDAIDILDSAIQVNKEIVCTSSKDNVDLSKNGSILFSQHSISGFIKPSKSRTASEKALNTAPEIVKTNIKSTRSILTRKNNRLTNQRCGAISIDPEESRQRTTKKKKTTQQKKLKTNRQSKAIKFKADSSLQHHQASSIVDIQQPNCNKNINSVTRLPPFSTLLPISNPRNRQTLSNTLNSLEISQSAISSSDSLCQSCFVSIESYKLLHACHQCLARICSSCGSTNDGENHFCRKCKSIIMKTL